MRILLIRHGHDERGYRGGWSKRGMTKEGFAQARGLAQYLCVHCQPIHLILSSDLHRAAETTAEILKVVQAPMQYAPEQREMNNGDLTRLPNDALAEERYPGLYFSSLAMDEPYLGGESPKQVFERISRAFEALSQKMITHQLPENVAVVTHGGVISTVHHLLKGLPRSNAHPSFPTAATGIHEISYLDDVWRITLENDIQHLNQD